MGWFGTVLIVVLCILGVGLVIAVGDKVFKALKELSEIIEKVLKKAGKPFVAVFEAVGGFFESLFSSLRLGSIDGFVMRHPNLGTKDAIITFMFSAVFTSVMATIYIIKHGLGDHLMEVFSMFPVFFVISLFNGHVSFSLSTLVSTGVSSLLIGLLFGNCMKNYLYHGFFNVRRFVSIAYYLVTAIAACEMGLLLSKLLDWLTQLGISAYDGAVSVITNSIETVGELFAVLGCIVAILLLLYVAALLMGVALKEYIESFTYGIIAFILFMGIMLGLQKLTETVAINQTLLETVELIILLLCIFVPDYIRVNKK